MKDSLKKKMDELAEKHWKEIAFVVEGDAPEHTDFVFRRIREAIGFALINMEDEVRDLKEIHALLLTGAETRSRMILEHNNKMVASLSEEIKRLQEKLAMRSQAGKGENNG